MLDGYKQVVAHTFTQKPIIIGKENNRESFIDFNDNDKVNSEGLIFILDTLPFWYMIETLNDNGKLIRREFKKFKEFDKDYKQ